MGKWRQEGTIKPRARRLGGVRTQPRAGLRKSPCAGGSASASPPPRRRAGCSVRARAPSSLFPKRRRALVPAGGHSGCVACEFPRVHAGPAVGMATGQPVPEPPARPLRTRRCHRRSRGRRRSHDAPRQPSPQWAAMLSE
ncbi:hypothetical protein ACRRTK_016537 [Alexandromys fortis]